MQNARLVSNECFIIINLERFVVSMTTSVLKLTLSLASAIFVAYKWDSRSQWSLSKHTVVETCTLTASCKYLERLRFLKSELSTSFCDSVIVRNFFTKAEFFLMLPSSFLTSSSDIQLPVISDTLMDTIKSTNTFCCKIVIKNSPGAFTLFCLNWSLCVNFDFTSSATCRARRCNNRCHYIQLDIFVTWNQYLLFLLPAVERLLRLQSHIHPSRNRKKLNSLKQ